MMRSTVLRSVVRLGFMLTFGGTVMAQAITAPETFNVFGKAQRQPGTYATASAAIPEGADSIGVKDTMTTADASDPTTKFVMTLFISSDGLVWRPVIREPFIGGTHFNRFTGQFEPNHINFSWATTELRAGEWVGWLVRAEIDQAVRLSIGFDVTVYPPGFNPQ